MGSILLSRIMEKGCVVNHAIWYVNALLNGLFKVDIQTGMTFYMGMPEKKEKYLKRAYSEILYYDGFLYMIPYNAKAIGLYHISTGQFDKISVSEKGNEKFYEAVLVGDKIYLLPYKANSFYCLDTETKSISKVDELKDIKIEVFSSIKRGEEIWFTETEGYSLYCYQPQNKECRRIDLDKTRGRYSSVGKVGNNIIVASIDKALAACIDPQTEDVTYYDFEKYSGIKGQRNYYITEYQEQAMLIRIGSNDCVVINLQNGEIIKKQFLPAAQSIYGKIWESELGLAMLPTIKDETFRFFDGRIIPLDEKNALWDWAKENDFRWRDCGPLPEYGLETLLKVIAWNPFGKSEKNNQYQNIYQLLKG